MDLKRPNKLRLSGKSGADEASAADAGGGLRAPGPPVNEVAELVADLIEATGLVSVPDARLVLRAHGAHDRSRTGRD